MPVKRSVRLRAANDESDPTMIGTIALTRVQVVVELAVRAIATRLAVFLLVWCAGCAASSGGARSGDAVGESSEERARIRATVDVLGREVGTFVDVRVDNALVDGKAGAGSRIARFV